MKASELVDKLNELIQEHCDAEVEIDSDEFPLTLSIGTVRFGNAYIGKGFYIYIHPTNEDAVNLFNSIYNES